MLLKRVFKKIDEIEGNMNISIYAYICYFVIGAELLVNIFNNKKVHTICITLAFIIISIVVIGAADGGAPGSELDPLVTKSFVEQKIDQIKYYTDSIVGSIGVENKQAKEEIAALKVQLQQQKDELLRLSQSSSGVAKFEVVELSKGQTLISGDGSEIIPRSGKMIAVYGKNGGLSDITSAKDLKAGEAIVLNHMLISSRDDGRGLKATTDVFLLVKGSYIVK